MTERCATVSRRGLLQAGATALLGTAFGGGIRTGDGPRRAIAIGRPQGGASVKALVFDTFGTVVDWRGSVTLEVEELARRKHLTVDGAKFADAWRAGYGPSMNRVRSGELPWTKLDRLHRMILDKVLIDLGLG